jgi:hypothetical protein
VIITTRDSKVSRYIAKKLRYVSSETDPRFSQNTKAPYMFSESEPKCDQLRIDCVSPKTNDTMI